MTCQECELLLIGDESGRDCEQHLAACSRCRALANELQANAAALRAMRDEVLPPIELPVARPGRRRVWIPAAAAALLILALGTARVWRLLQPVERPPALAISIPPPPPVRIPDHKRPPMRVLPPQTLVVKMLTPDPHIVIYWLIEPNQGDLE